MEYWALLQLSGKNMEGKWFWLKKENRETENRAATTEYSD